MHIFTIESIKRTKTWINGIRVHLDHPTPEIQGGKSHSIFFKGWVTSLKEEIDEIYLTWLDNRIVTARIVPRLDVQEGYPESKSIAGFELEITPIVCGRNEPLLIVLATKEGRSSPLFEIHLRFENGGSGKDETGLITPTFGLIVGSGRCGTTLLAQRLLRSNAVIGRDEYPYESHLASRLSWKWFSELQPGHYYAMANGESPDQGFSAVYSSLSNCTGDAQRLETMSAFYERTGQQTREDITQLYKLIDPKKAASVILEKFDANTQLGLYLLRAIFKDFRPIFLIRDPRDIILSVRNFNETRQNYGFHEINALDFSAQILRLATILRRLEKYYDDLEGPKILVKYEDLVRSPSTVMLEVFNFLGISYSSKEITKILSECPIREKHATSRSPEESINRWKYELTEAQQEEANWVLKPVTSRYGY